MVVVLVVVAIVIVIALGVGLGLGLKKDDDKPASGSDAQKGVFKSAAVATDAEQCSKVRNRFRLFYSLFIRGGWATAVGLKHQCQKVYQY